jgi:radical SAM superfamily enzyme YgiQ (UPF0313 family)
MRVSLAFPPSLCLPNQVYYALPLLAGALRRAGHAPRCVDLNLVCADRLLEPATAETIIDAARGLARATRTAGNRRFADEIDRHVDSNAALARLGRRFKQQLRDPLQFYDQRAFHDGFWSIVDILAAFYGLDPTVSPFLPDFRRRVQDNQRRDSWTVMTHLYEHGLLDEVLAGDPELIGVCLAFPEQAVETVRLLRRLRQRAPHVPICVGGPLLTGFADVWLEDGWLLDHCDFVCIGDGERTIVELCDALLGRRGLDAVTNLGWRDRDGRLHRPTHRHLEPMDEMPEPDFDACDLARSFLPEPIYPLMLSRGCYWGKCTFCSIGWRENYRMASKSKIRADVQAVVRRGGRFVQLQDSSVPPAAAKNLASVLREDGLDVTWVSGMKFERCLVDADFCNHLGGAGGCRSLLMGFEAADQRLLDLMQKGYRLEDLPAMLANLRAAGISVEMLWFIGFPTQSRADVAATARWLVEHRADYGMTAFVGDYFLHPDTEVFDRPDDFGLRIVGQDNDRMLYEVAAGMQPAEAALLKRLLAGNNNRTLTCNGSHLPHLSVSGIDLTTLARPMRLPAAAEAFCAAGALATAGPRPA